MNYQLTLNDSDVAKFASHLSFGLPHIVRSTPNTVLCIYTQSLAGQGGLQTKYLTTCVVVSSFKADSRSAVKRMTVFYEAENASCSYPEPLN